MSEERFDISAAVVRQLGEELVSDEITALVELVKNAYDADASYASVTVDTDATDAEGRLGSLVIEDDGFGMDREDISRGWLTISLSSKRAMKERGETTPGGRTPLGDKGLGRLSAQRLGERLELLTRKDGSPAYRVGVDWMDFSEGHLLSEVNVDFDELAPRARRVGTTLSVTGLTNLEDWSGRRRTELVRRLSQLISPFEPGRTFRVLMNIDGHTMDLEGLAESVREAAVGRFSISYEAGTLHVGGKIRLSRLRGNTDAHHFHRLVEADNGRKFFEFLKSDRNPTRMPDLEYLNSGGWFIEFTETRSLGPGIGGVAYEESSDPNGSRRVADPGPFEGEIDEFQLRGTDLEDIPVFNRTREFSQYVQSQAGVRVFRDGFGIRPYGVDGNDWLNLGGGQTSGRSYYGLRPNNVVGYVRLTAAENQELQEKTDREGFIESPHSQNFFLLMLEAVRLINTSYSRIRRGFVAFQKAHSSEEVGPETFAAPFAEMRSTAKAAAEVESRATQAEEQLEGITERIEAVRRKTGKSTDPTTDDLLAEASAALQDARKVLSEVRKLLPNAEQLGAMADLLEPRIDSLESQLEEFSELAGLGLIAEALSHEIHNVADGLADRTRSMVRRLGDGDHTQATISEYLEHVLSAATALRKQLSHLAPSLKYVRESREVIDLRPLVEELGTFYRDRLESKGISFEVGAPFESFTIRMNRGRLIQIIDNLVLNSEYWLKEAMRAGRVEGPSITLTAERPYLRIQDSGMGVEPAVESTLFQPFVTTKPRGEGRGLGLFIAQQLLDSISGFISLLPDRNAHGRRYIFQVDLSGVVHDS